MNNFEEIKSNWKKQPPVNVPQNGLEEVLKKVNGISGKQKITNIVLGVTVVVLVFFMIYVAGFKNKDVTIGLSIMIGVLIIRVLIELFSLKNLKQLAVILDVESFKTKLLKYYKSRITVHYVFTPILFISYVLGFILLLPSFKKHLSEGFYNYVVISSVPVLIGLCIFITMHIRKEIKQLKQLSKGL